MGALGTLIPLVIFFGFLAGFGWVGYQMYLYTNQLADRGVKHLEKKNITYSKDGLKVGVKERNDEELQDKGQEYVVKAWNHASFPGYKSKIYNTEPTPDFKRTPSGSSTAKSEPKPATSRSSTGLSNKS